MEGSAFFNIVHNNFSTNNYKKFEKKKNDKKKKHENKTRGRDNKSLEGVSKYDIHQVTFPLTSKLGAEEQSQFLYLFLKYNGNNFISEDSQDYKWFLDMCDTIHIERQKFHNFVEEKISHDDYRERLSHLSPEAKQFSTAKWKRKLQDVLRYPQFYSEISRIPLNACDEYDILFYPERLLYEQGSPFTFSEYELQMMNKIPETGSGMASKIPENYNSFHQPTVSDDQIAEELAISSEANIVISSSALKIISDNYAPFKKMWHIPVVVKEYKIGDKVKKVVYLDKAFPPRSLTASKRNLWYFKNYIRERRRTYHNFNENQDSSILKSRFLSEKRVGSLEKDTIKETGIASLMSNDVSCAKEPYIALDGEVNCNYMKERPFPGTTLTSSANGFKLLKDSHLGTRKLKASDNDVKENYYGDKKYESPDSVQCCNKLISCSEIVERDVQSAENESMLEHNYSFIINTLLDNKCTNTDNLKGHHLFIKNTHLPKHAAREVNKTGQEKTLRMIELLKYLQNIEELRKRHENSTQSRVTGMRHENNTQSSITETSSRIDLHLPNRICDVKTPHDQRVSVNEEDTKSCKKSMIYNESKMKDVNDANQKSANHENICEIETVPYILALLRSCVLAQNTKYQGIKRKNSLYEGCKDDSFGNVSKKKNHVKEQFIPNKNGLNNDEYTHTVNHVMAEEKHEVKNTLQESAYQRNTSVNIFKQFTKSKEEKHIVTCISESKKEFTRVSVSAKTNGELIPAVPTEKYAEMTDLKYKEYYSQTNKVGESGTLLDTFSLDFSRISSTTGPYFSKSLDKSNFDKRGFHEYQNTIDTSKDKSKVYSEMKTDMTVKKEFIKFERNSNGTIFGEPKGNISKSEFRETNFIYERDINKTFQSGISNTFCNSSVNILKKVQYRLWKMSLEERSDRIMMKNRPQNQTLNIIIRCKTDSFVDAGANVTPVIMIPKLEYKSEFGGECMTRSEATQQNISLFVRPETDLLRVRMDALKSEKIMFEHLPSKKVIRKDMEILGPAIKTIYTVLKHLTSVEAGKYIIVHTDRLEAFASLMQAKEDGGTFNLYSAYDVNPNKVEPVGDFEYPNIDHSVFLPWHIDNRRIPCTFDPPYKKSLTSFGKPSGKCKSKKKKNRRKNKKLRETKLTKM